MLAIIAGHSCASGVQPSRAAQAPDVSDSLATATPTASAQQATPAQALEVSDSLPVASRKQDSVVHVFTTDASAVRERQRLLFGDEAGWAEAWKHIASNRTPAPALPLVDFGRWRVALANEGIRDDGGTVRITGTTVERDTLVIHVTAFFTPMCPGFLRATNVQKSTDAVLIPRHPTAFVFRERLTIIPCR